MRPALRLAAFPLLFACRQAPPAIPPPRPILDGVVGIGPVALHLHCIGEGDPTVVFESGLEDDGSGWRGVQASIGRFTRACAYDRAGLGYSTPPSAKPHTNFAMAGELHDLLNRAGLPGPYVFVAHSMGGVNVRLFANAHPEELAGLVLVDAVTGDEPARYWSLLPTTVMDEFRHGLSHGHEGLDFDTFVGGIAAMKRVSQSIGDKPLIVLTRSIEDALPDVPPEKLPELLSTWQALQADLVHLSSNAVQVIAPKSHHFIQADDPELVIAAVTEVVRAVRSNSHVRAKALTPNAP